MTKKDKKDKNKGIAPLSNSPKSQPPILPNFIQTTASKSNDVKPKFANDKSALLARQLLSATSSTTSINTGDNANGIKSSTAITAPASKQGFFPKKFATNAVTSSVKIPSSVTRSPPTNSAPVRNGSLDSTSRINLQPTPLSRGISSASASANSLSKATPAITGVANGVAVVSGDPELELLRDDPSTMTGRSKDHELKTAPILTRDAYVAAGYREHTTQYGVLGKTLSIYSKDSKYVPSDPCIYVNTNAPFSAVVCGVQGSGKSHTVSILLENMLIPNLPQIGSLERPLAGLVLHFGEGGPSSRPSEAAWVGVSNLDTVRAPPVHVYVSRSSLNTMRAVYAPLGNRLTVEPLLFTQDELDAQAFLSMMAVGSSESAPLYIQVVLSILRELGENFSYNEFMNRLEEKKQSFNPAQLAGLEQRMALLNSFVDHEHPPERRFVAGQLTIIDLSDPFIDPGSACGLFEIITRLFVRAEVGTGKVLVVDEAHKYLSSHKSASGLTNSLLTLTREQRHLAMRVIISTQEPTVVPPVLLDLCTVSIIHRFSSPSWWDHLAHHVSADISADSAFDKVVKLQTGEAIILAPSGYGVFPDVNKSIGKEMQIPTLNQFGRRYLLMKTRRRVTRDGGGSILVVN